jgi:hypothetical protein
MLATDFRGWARIKDLDRDVSLSRMEGLGSVWGGALRKDFFRVGKLIVHRGCTGNAERQWSVGERLETAETALEV